MGDLVVMPVRQASPQLAEAGHSAAILFFTGVRYFRMAEPAPAPARRRRGPRARRPEVPSPELQA